MHRFARVAFLLLGSFGAGCIGRSASSGGGDTPAAAQAGQAPQAAVVPKGSKLKPCKGQLVPADDGLIDDFEDDDRQSFKVAERDGYWWKHADGKGSVFEPDEVLLVGPGAASSEKALHVTGKLGSGDEAYGVLVGVNFSSAGLYDAEPYAGIRFKAKADPGTAMGVRFEIGDVNTHKDAGVCKTCWNHFGKDVALTTEWGEYAFSFAELQQQPGWGDPNPPSLTAGALYSVDWAIKKGGTFGFWLDDVEFLRCQE